jgi:hypothetical protein
MLQVVQPDGSSQSCSRTCPPSCRGCRSSQGSGEFPASRRRFSRTTPRNTRRSRHRRDHDESHAASIRPLRSTEFAMSHRQRTDMSCCKPRYSNALSTTPVRPSRQHFIGRQRKSSNASASANNYQIDPLPVAFEAKQRPYDIQPAPLRSQKQIVVFGEPPQLQKHNLVYAAIEEVDVATSQRIQIRRRSSAGSESHRRRRGVAVYKVGAATERTDGALKAELIDEMSVELAQYDIDHQLEIIGRDGHLADSGSVVIDDESNWHSR